MNAADAKRAQVGGTDNRVFLALADPTRRQLLDCLFLRDGQRLSELCDGFDISRQAVSKHIDVLLDAGLVTTRRASGATLYFLNRVPLREIHSRWMRRFVDVRPRIECF